MKATILKRLQDLDKCNTGPGVFWKVMSHELKCSVYVVCLDSKLYFWMPKSKYVFSGVSLSNGLNDVNLHETAVRESVQLLRLWRATIDRRVEATPKVSRKLSADTLKASQSLKSMPRTAVKTVSTPRIAQNCSSVRRRQTAKKSRKLEIFAHATWTISRSTDGIFCKN